MLGRSLQVGVEHALRQRIVSRDEPAASRHGHPQADAAQRADCDGVAEQRRDDGVGRWWFRARGDVGDVGHHVTRMRGSMKTLSRSITRLTSTTKIENTMRSAWITG